jgi:hypothetical protein
MSAPSSRLTSTTPLQGVVPTTFINSLPIRANVTYFELAFVLEYLEKFPSADKSLAAVWYRG